MAGMTRPAYYVDPFRISQIFRPPGIVLGPDGIPLVLYPGIGYHDNP